MSDMKNSGEEEEHTCSYNPVIMEVLHTLHHILV